MNKKKTRRRLKKKRILLAVLILIIIISIIVYLLIPKTYGYKKEVIEVFKENNVSYNPISFTPLPWQFIYDKICSYSP